MSSFLDSTGLSRLASKITDYFAKKDGTYPNMTVGSANTLPRGYVKFSASLTGYKHLATIDVPSASQEVIASFDLYETIAANTFQNYRGVLSVRVRNDAGTYSYGAVYTGKPFTKVALSVRRSANTNRILIYITKLDESYCGLYAILRGAGNWGASYENGKVSLNQDPGIEDVSGYPEIPLTQNLSVTASFNGVGSTLTPVYVDSAGQVQASPWFNWNQIRSDNDCRILPPYGARTRTSVTIPANSTSYIQLCSLDNNTGGIYWIATAGQNNPKAVEVEFEWFTYGDGYIRENKKAGYSNSPSNAIQAYSAKTFNNGSAVAFFVKVYNNTSTGRTVNIFSSRDIASSSFAVLTEAEYNALGGTLVMKLNSNYRISVLSSTVSLYKDTQPYTYANGAVGSSELPVYVDAAGQVLPATLVTSGRAISSNTSLPSGSSLSNGAMVNICNPGSNAITVSYNSSTVGTVAAGKVGCFVWYNGAWHKHAFE